MRFIKKHVHKLAELSCNKNKLFFEIENVEVQNNKIRYENYFETHREVENDLSSLAQA
jgi:hypothetical protein